MGISGLLPVLKEIQVHGNISEFRGKRLAVDAYVWLHKGAFGCAEDIVKGKKTTKFVDYAMYRVRLLRHHGIEPYIVFDGGPLPAKKKTEVSREKSRAENLARAQALESQGRLRDARDLYTKCVDITPEMALQLIKALRAENVDYIVAPYEADAQLCWLEREGYVDGIITEDSDLLVFGCRQVIFKLEGNGMCVSIKAEKLATVSAFPMHGWTDVQFRRMAMLSGCDYLDSIPGIGLKTAHRLLRRHKTVEKVVQMIKLEGTLHVPAGYIESFAQAELAFIHQRVYDPALKKLVPLNGFPAGGLKEDDAKWVGLDMEPEVARGIAEGRLHPETGDVLDDICPGYQPASRNAQKITPAVSSKAKVAGPMDAFISRSKVTKVKPLPTPVGQAGSGVSRLSECNINIVTTNETPTIPKKSRFFGGRGKPEPEPVELVWEDSQDKEPQLGSIPIHIPEEEIAPPTPAKSDRSPSACASVRSNTPAEINHGNEPISFADLTSPAAPVMSSPAVSSPPQGETFTSPRSQKSTLSRSLSPVSPTKSRVGIVAQTHSVLVPSTSQLHRPQADTSQHESESRPWLQAGVLGTSTYSNFDSSSTTNGNSDSFEDEEVVTPSLNVGCGHKRQRSYEEEVIDVDADEIDEAEIQQEVDRMRAEKAKVISHDWRLKYAFGANHTPITRPAATRTISGPAKRQAVASSRTPIHTRSNEENGPAARATPLADKRPPMRQRASMPLSATMPRILHVKPVNIPDTPDPARSKPVEHPERKIGGTVLIPSSDLATATPAMVPSSDPPVVCSSSPMSSGSSGEGVGRLMKYKFTGKVDTRQMSSSQL